MAEKKSVKSIIFVIVIVALIVTNVAQKFQSDKLERVLLL